MGVERIVSRQVTFFPNQFIEFFLGEDLFRVLEQHLENLTLFLCKANGFSCVTYFKTIRIELDIFKALYEVINFSSISLLMFTTLA